MSFLGQALQNPLHPPSDGQNPGGNHRGRWSALVIVMLALVVAGVWAWPRFINTGTVTTQATAPVVANAQSNRTDASSTVNATVNTATTQTQTVAQTQPVVANAPTPGQEPTAAPAAVTAMTTTQTTGVVVLAGTEGATLLTTPDGESVTTVAVGALLSATGRNADGSWIYVSSPDGTAGWVAIDQLVAFGLEKLPVVTLTAPAPAQPAVASETPITTTATVSATTPSGETTRVITATNPITATDAEAVTTVGATGVTATVTVTGSRLNIRSGPGTRYAIVGKATRNETVTVLARNAAADWVQIALPDREDSFGWVAAAYLRASSALAELPVSDAVSTAPILTAATTTTTTAATNTATTPAETAPPTTQPAATQPTAVAQANPATGLSGTLVFQVSPGGMIYAYNLASGRLWQLTNGFDPAISPNGQTVAFVRTAGENGIYLINIDGSNERLIFSGRNTLAAPKWSPDGAYILFTRGDEYKECRDIGRGMCLTDKELLSQNPNFPVDDYPLVKDYESNLARVDSNGDNYRDIANLESARAADWNEAGIVYQSTAGLQITADTPDATSQLVTHDPFKPAYEDPDWQPGSAGSPGKIVFVSRSGNHREIYAVNPDGSGMVALTKPVTTLVAELPNNVAPAWSPDGRHIVFLSNRGDDNSAGAWKLWVMDADGSNQHPLPIEVAINYTYGNEQLVSWGR